MPLLIYCSTVNYHLCLINLSVLFIRVQNCHTGCAFSVTTPLRLEIIIGLFIQMHIY